MHVAALALVDADGLVLMHRRRKSSMHGGLWEFPGGKLEAGESYSSATVREIREELGIDLSSQSLVEVGVAENIPGQGDQARTIVIRLFMAREWIGQVQCLEGEEIAWFAPEQLSGLAMPPLDYPLAQHLLACLAKEAK